MEIQRFGLQDNLLSLIQKTRIPVAATILGKSVIGEHHPLYLGVYEGSMGREAVRKYVESSDCLIFLGAFMTDINLGIYTARIDPAQSIYANSERVSIRYHNYENIRLRDFIHGLIKSKIRIRHSDNIPNPERPQPFIPRRGKKRLTVKRLFQRLNWFLKDNTIIISDVGDALFGSIELCIYRNAEFLSPAYYTSMGFAVPASIGAQMANPKLRALVIVGDGAFQMTGMELYCSAIQTQSNCNRLEQ